MVRSIVKDHKGLIDFTSQVGEGSSFHIYFPVLESIPEKPSKQTMPEKVGVITGNETILLVDDDKHLSILGKTMLEKFGYMVTPSNSGEEAIKRYSHGMFDLVILDMDMPGIGGIECLQIIQGMNQNAKVIAISGHTSDDHMEDALRNGAHAFIAKPFSIDELLGTVRNVLDME